jgi:hypothetical protein
LNEHNRQTKSDLPLFSVHSPTQFLSISPRPIHSTSIDPQDLCPRTIRQQLVSAIIQKNLLFSYTAILRLTKDSAVQNWVVSRNITKFGRETVVSDPSCHPSS